MSVFSCYQSLVKDFRSTMKTAWFFFFCHLLTALFFSRKQLSGDISKFHRSTTVLLQWKLYNCQYWEHRQGKTDWVCLKITPEAKLYYLPKVHNFILKIKKKVPKPPNQTKPKPKQTKNPTKKQNQTKTKPPQKAPKQTNSKNDNFLVGKTYTCFARMTDVMWNSSIKIQQPHICKTSALI